MHQLSVGHVFGVFEKALDRAAGTMLGDARREWKTVAAKLVSTSTKERELKEGEANGTGFGCEYARKYTE